MDKTINLTVTGQQAEPAMEAIQRALHDVAIAGELRVDTNAIEFTASAYMGMSVEDKRVVDRFLNAVGVRPITCTAITIHLREDWDTMQGDDG